MASSSVSPGYSNYLTSQEWNKPLALAEGRLLQPLKLQEYSKVPNWNGLPLFWMDREVVQIFDVDDNKKTRILFPYRELRGCDAMLYETQERGADGIDHQVQALATPLFKTNIAYWADMAAGITPDPLKITHDLPPPNLLMPIECQGISVRFNQAQISAMTGWIVLTPLTAAEYRILGDHWDRLPLFKDPEGAIVRPYIFCDHDNKPLMSESDQGTGPYFLFLPHEMDNLETRSKFCLKHTDEGQKIASTHTKLLYDQPINQEEEKN